MLDGQTSLRDLLADYFLARAELSGIGGTNYGHMVDAMSHLSEACPTCSGAGFRELTQADRARWRNRINDESDPYKRKDLRLAMREATTCPTCRGMKVVPSGSPETAIDRHFVTYRCSACRGCGEVFDEDLEDVCPECYGQTYTVPVTVHETADSEHRGFDFGAEGIAPKRSSHKRAPGQYFDPGDWISEDSPAGALVSMIRAKSPKTLRVLETYYGPYGDLYGPHKWGREFSVWPLTRPGKSLAVISAKRRTLDLIPEPIVLIASERNDYESGRAAPQSGPLIEVAAQYALGMVARAHRAVEALAA